MKPVFYANIVNLMNKSITRQEYNTFFQLAWPCAAEGFLMELLSSIDLAMVGTLGSKAQSAVGIVSQPKMMNLIFVRAIAVAITAVLARRYGEDKLTEMRSVLKQGLTIVFVLYAVILSVEIFSFKNIMLISGAKEEYLAMSISYGRLIFISLIFQVLSIMLMSALVAIGRTKIIFAANLAGNILNCLINYVFIFGRFSMPKLGVTGAGIGTLCGSMVTFIIIAAEIQKKSSLLRLDSGNWIPRGYTFKAVAVVLTGTLPQQIFERLGMYLYTIIVASLGSTALAVHHICMSLCDVFYSVAIGLGTATSSITGQMMGKRQIDAAVRYAEIGQKLGIIVAVSGFAVFSVFNKLILGIFTHDAAVMELGSKILIVVALVSFPQTFSLVNSGVLKGAGDTRFVAAYSFIIIAVFRPILTYILIFVFDMGVFGAWAALFVDQSLRAIAASIRFHSMKWTELEL